MVETREREGVEREGRKRRCGTESVEYLKERREHNDKLKGEEIVLRNSEITLKEKREEGEKNERKRTRYEGERERESYT